jgi:putative hydrolase of the HAD superfamily
MMNIRTRIRCITFDLDDTLWECAPVIHRAEDRFYTWLKRNFPKVVERFSYRELMENRIKFMRAHPSEMHNLTRLRKKWLRDVAILCGDDESLVEPGFDIFWQARNEVELFDDVESTLEKLGEQYLIGAITNGNADVHRIGIGHLFDFVVTSEEVGASKPDNKMFEAAAAKAGMELGHILHVGDDSQRDVIGAIQAGALAAWVKCKQADWCEEQKPQLTVTHVRELLDHL